MWSHPLPPKNLTPGIRVETCDRCHVNIGANGCNCFRYEGKPAIPAGMTVAEYRRSRAQ